MKDLQKKPSNASCNITNDYMHTKDRIGMCKKYKHNPKNSEDEKWPEKSKCLGANCHFCVTYVLLRPDTMNDKSASLAPFK